MLLGAVLFGLGLGITWISDWRLHDVIWGFWITSLAVGYLMIIGILVHQAHHQIRDLGMARGQVAVGALFMLGFFTFHFGFFTGATRSSWSCFSTGRKRRISRSGWFRRS